MRVGLWGRGRWGRGEGIEIIKKMNTFPLLVYISPYTVDLSVITPTKTVYVTCSSYRIRANKPIRT
jgi:hypothetical protein